MVNKLVLVFTLLLMFFYLPNVFASEVNVSQNYNFTIDDNISFNNEFALNSDDVLLAQNSGNNSTNDGAEIHTKSAVGAWAMSFFIGIAVPVLGIGQYYAQSYGTAIPTTIFGCVAAGVAVSGAMNKNNSVMWAGVASYFALWLFDWIYAIIATNNFNNQQMESAIRTAPVLPYVSINTFQDTDRVVIDNVFNVGLSCRI